MEDHTQKREEEKDGLSPEEEKDIQNMRHIREQQHEQAMDRLERFQQQAAPDYTTSIGTTKYTVSRDEYGYPFVSKKEPMAPEEQKEMDEISYTLFGYRDSEHRFWQDGTEPDADHDDKGKVDPEVSKNNLEEPER